MQSNLQQTVFQIEKLRNIVGVGNCSAYQICASPGESLGRVGLLPDSVVREAANQALFDDRSAESESVGTKPIWLKKVISSLTP